MAILRKVESQKVKFHEEICRVILSYTVTRKKKSEVSGSAARSSNYDAPAKRSPIPNRFMSLTTVRESACGKESKLDGNTEFDLGSVLPHLINRKFASEHGERPNGYF